MTTINPGLASYLAAASVTTNGKANREWFETSRESSKEAIAFAKKEADRELAAMLEDVREGYGDDHPAA